MGKIRLGTKFLLSLLAISAGGDVADGRYRLHVWYERSSPEDLQTLERDVKVSSSTRALGSVRVMLNPNWNLAHKNKYGQEYVPSPSSSCSDH